MEEIPALPSSTKMASKETVDFLQMWDKQLINWWSISCIKRVSHQSDGRCQNLLRTHSILWLGGSINRHLRKMPHDSWCAWNILGWTNSHIKTISWSEGCLGYFLGKASWHLRRKFWKKPSLPNPFQNQTSPSVDYTIPQPLMEEILHYLRLKKWFQKMNSCNQPGKQLLNWCSISYISPFHFRIGRQ